MKKFLFLTSMIISLLIINSCNSKKEAPPPQTDIIADAQIVETEQVPPEQSWKEILLSNKAIETEKDIESIKQIIDMAVENNTLDELQTFLETEAKKDKVPPQILFSLSLVYGRKGLIKEEYKAIEKLEEQVKQRPGIAFNLSLVYGRKGTLKSQIDKAEAEALALLKGYISVTSTPEGAEIYLDGVLKGTTPFTTKGLEERSYSVEIQKEDYITLSRTAVVKAGETIAIAEELALIPGNLVINSNPAGATVLLDGEELGITPFEILKIDAGNYKLIFKLNDHQNYSEIVELTQGEHRQIKPDLIHFTGSLQISHLTDSATVFLDGEKLYPAGTDNPVLKIVNNIDTGYHLLVIKKEDYTEKSESILISRDKNTVVNGFLVYNEANI